MSKIININDSYLTVSMNGFIDLEHYCPKCTANEFHSVIGTSCAHCGIDINDISKYKTIFECNQEEKEFLLKKASFINKNVTRVGMSAYKNQKELNIQFDREK